MICRLMRFEVFLFEELGTALCPLLWLTDCDKKIIFACAWAFKGALMVP